MNIIRILPLLATLFASAGFAADAATEADFPRGPNNGRLLSDGDFAVELAIFEDGVPPEYRAWAYADGTTVGPQNWTLEISLTRLGGVRNDFAFAPAGTFLRGDGVVEEPHSFDVRVTAEYQGRRHTWTYPSYEGRVSIADGLAAELHIETAIAGAGTLHQRVLLYGKTVPDPQGVSHVTARYPGLIRSIDADLGQRVTAGDTLAIIEANTSLQRYTLTAPISGLVIQRHANAGEVAGEQALLTIADYSNVWVDLDVFPGDARTVQPGQTVDIRMGELRAQSSILYLNPGAGDSPNVIARVPLANPQGYWTPGLLVEGEVLIAETPVPLLIDNRALQDFRDWRVVFIKIGDTYEIRPLTLGRSDGRFTEVLDGLNAGDAYVVINSYLLKADLEKSGASHDH